MAVPQLTFQKSTHYEDALGRAAAECGIDYQYWDIFGHSHEASVDAKKSILNAIGWDVSSVESIDKKRAELFQSLYTLSLQQTIVISDSERFVPLTLPAHTPGTLSDEITLESGERVAGQSDTSQVPLLREVHFEDKHWCTFLLPLAERIPFGYHRLALLRRGAEMTVANLILCPDRAYLPDSMAKGLKTAGFNVALYGLRSKRNWGCGDFTDLRALLDWSFREVGFSFVGVNPLHALHNRTPYNTSPYLPLSVYYKNLIYLDIETIPEFSQCPAAVQLLHSEEIQRRLQELRDAPFVEYQAVDAIKKRFLGMLHLEFRDKKNEGSARSRAFAAYCEREGDLLHKFALYCALDQILHEEDGNRWTWRDCARGDVRRADRRPALLRAAPEAHRPAEQQDGHGLVKHLGPEQLAHVEVGRELAGGGAAHDSGRSGRALHRAPRGPGRC